MWKWFSLYVRLRDSDGNGDCRCITCGRSKHYKNMDAGHYVPRAYMECKYDEKNVHAQCAYCNRNQRGGMEIMYGAVIEERYGKKTNYLASGWLILKCTSKYTTLRASDNHYFSVSK